ncbi:enoyl-CoA hydratase-related protein [Micromonospora sp. DT62]|uniref:enoyl-CoA hydratase-related protein n=1 Tax=Micromonospora sp. DT62 TaxID=3416521 RepID=UPI003CF8BBA9
MDTYREIVYSVSDRIATVSLNRPEERNGYTLRMADELAHAFDRADRDDDVRVVVLTGTGEHFCAGLDPSVTEFDTPDDPEAEWAEPAGRCSMRIFAMNKPVIAAIRGAAVGAGATIILPADYRLAATDARFGYVFSRRGIYAEGASTWFLPRLVGMGRALDWMISGRAFDAAEALSAGLVHSVHEPEHLLDKAYQLARTIIATTAPVSVAVIRQMLYRTSALDSPYPAHRLDSRLSAEALTSADAREGFDSFRQRRAPAFPGRVSSDLPDHLPWRSE